MDALPMDYVHAVRPQVVFAVQFLERGPNLDVPQGRYDLHRQVYVRDDDGQPAFVNDQLFTKGGNEITTHFTTAGRFRDPDNG